MARAVWSRTPKSQAIAKTIFRGGGIPLYLGGDESSRAILAGQRGSFEAPRPRGDSGPCTEPHVGSWVAGSPTDPRAMGETPAQGPGQLVSRLWAPGSVEGVWKALLAHPVCACPVPSLVRPGDSRGGQRFGAQAGGVRNGAERDLPDLAEEGLSHPAQGSCHGVDCHCGGQDDSEDSAVGPSRTRWACEGKMQPLRIGYREQKDTIFQRKSDTPVPKPSQSRDWPQGRREGTAVS